MDAALGIRDRAPTLHTDNLIIIIGSLREARHQATRRACIMRPAHSASHRVSLMGTYHGGSTQLPEASTVSSTYQSAIGREAA